MQHWWWLRCCHRVTRCACVLSAAWVASPTAIWFYATTSFPFKLFRLFSNLSDDVSECGTEFLLRLSVIVFLT